MMLAAEEELLFASCRSALDEVHRDRIVGLVHRDLDWAMLVETAIRHAVAPLVWHALAACGREALDPVPAEVAEELRAIHDGNGRRSRRLLGVTADVVRHLAEDHIPVMALKDVHLVPEVYPDPALRPMGDVDLLVHRDDFERSATRLGDLGFVPVPDRTCPYARKWASGQQLRRPSDETWIDLQWHVAEREWNRHGDGAFTFPSEELWERAVSFRLDGVDLWAPSPEDMLVHLCIHLEGHRYAELVLFADLVELLRHHGSGFRWDRFVDRAMATGTASAVHHVLALGREALGLPVPVAVIEQLPPTYFDGPVSFGLFDNLTPLHTSLDDLVRIGTPARVLDRSEVLVRRQASCATAGRRAVDEIVEALTIPDSTSVSVLAEPSERRFPDPTLRPFGRVDVLLAGAHRPLVDLAGSGWRHEHDGTWIRTNEVHPADPYVADPLVLRVRVHEQTDPGALLQHRSPAVTNRDAAMASLRGLLRRHPEGPDELHVDVHCLDRAALVAVLAVRIGEDPTDRLFRAVAAHAAAGRSIDGDTVMAAQRLADNHDRGGDAAAGLDVLAALWGWPERSDDRVTEGRPARVLEWARYGPSSLETRPELREAYLLLLGARGHPTLSGATRHLLSGFAAGGAVRRLAAHGVAATTGRTSGTPQPRSTRDLAFWLEPDEPSHASAGSS